MQKFEVTHEHIKLFHKFYWDNQLCEYGAPAVDPKRPYGNSSVEDDISRILGMDPELCPHCGEIINEKVSEYCGLIHRQMKFALQVFSDTLTIEIGDYRKDGFEKWKKVE
jgi:hypothetical protein